VRNESIPWARYGAALGAIAFVTVMLAGTAAALRKRREDPLRLRRRAAAATAQRRWKDARTLDPRTDAAAFVEQAMAAFLGLVADLAGIRAAGLTPKDAGARLESLGLDAGLLRDLRHFFDAVEGCRYGSAALDAQKIHAEGDALLRRLVLELQRGGHLS
jgi:hypothetical protein